MPIDDAAAAAAAAVPHPSVMYNARAFFIVSHVDLPRGVYPYLPLATNAPTTIWEGDFIKSLTNFSIQKSI